MDEPAAVPAPPVGFVVGLTGGIGSGKSTVASLFVALGAALIDTDALAHALTGPHGDAMPALIQAFGPAVAGPDGALDRARMRERVFSDPIERARLEAILHPMIRAAAQRALDSTAAPYALLAVPLLSGSGGYRERMDRILVVDCSRECQIARVIRRSGLSLAQVMAIIAVQATREQRLAMADDVIDNDGEEFALEPQVEKLHQQYLRLAQSKRSAARPRSPDA
ncbi:MAG: dephospho-CoA kinase [Rhodocyclaceae bacterium]|nr:dephospho-CoA kinase [Rhodocyclaceae bacterium]